MVKRWRWCCGALSVTCALILGALSYFYFTLPNTYLVTNDGEAVTVGKWVSVPTGLYRATSHEHQQATAEMSSGAHGEYVAPMRLFGVFPIKSVSVSVVDAPVVTVCGTPFGIKLYADGVLVVGLSDVNTAGGGVNPAAAAGIRIGDTIVSINGTPVTTNEQVAAIINACGGKAVKLRIRREGVEFDASFTPVRPTDDDGYRAGLWVRDSTAGVGILTFYDEKTSAFAGLGHPVCDADTGKPFTISGGEIVPACILDVKRSEKGAPGELCGMFEDGSLGRLTTNATSGLYGTLTAKPSEGVRLPLAMKQEVKQGAAQVLTTIDGINPELYEISIEQVRYAAANDTRGMVIRVTDERLLAETGGIVQGMSGSPIIQDGKLVGAITHVLVNDPSKGYAIFAETMLETAKGIAQNHLKEAS